MITLETQRLILRPYTQEDWQSVHEYGKLEDFSKFEVWGPNTDQDSKNFVQMSMDKMNHRPLYEYEWAIVLKSNQKHIGGCGLRRTTELSQVADFGYAVNPKFQNQGIATEATQKLLNFGFNTLKLQLIYAMCHVDNHASQKVIQKCSLKKVGCIKNHLKFKDGSTADSNRYEISKAEFNAL